MPIKEVIPLTDEEFFKSIRNKLHELTKDSKAQERERVIREGGLSYNYLVDKYFNFNILAFHSWKDGDLEEEMLSYYNHPIICCSPRCYKQLRLLSGFDEYFKYDVLNFRVFGDIKNKIICVSPLIKNDNLLLYGTFDVFNKTLLEMISYYWKYPTKTSITDLINELERDNDRFGDITFHNKILNAWRNGEDMTPYIDEIDKLTYYKGTVNG